PASRGTGDAAAATRAAARGCERVAQEEGVEVEVRLPSRPIRVGVATDLAERVLAPLVENGCRHGSGAVEISVERRGGSVLFTVADDGRGVGSRSEERR